MCIASNVGELRRRIAQALPALARIEGANARLEAEHLALHALTIDRERFLSLRNEDSIDPIVLDQFGVLLGRRLRLEPLQYILGRTPFCDLDLEVGPGVLIPRNETEVLVQRVLYWTTGAAPMAANHPLSSPGILVDVGTGSGAILLALLSALPELRGIGVDLSPAALTYARRNRSRYPRLAERSQLVRGDFLSSVGRAVQIVVANPPYIDSADLLTLGPEVREHEPAIALDGGPDGLDPARRIAEQAARRLVSGGLLALELAPTQPARLAAELATSGRYRVLECFSDLAGRPRGIVAERI